MLASAWLHKSPGFDSIAKAVLYYQNAMEGQLDPQLAFKDLTWLTSLETTD